MGNDFHIVLCLDMGCEVPSNLSHDRGDAEFI